MEVYGFPHQVGGHFGLLSIPGHVCKPYNHREFEFYTQMDAWLLPFAPKLCSKIKVQCLGQSNEDGVLEMNTEQLVVCHPQSADMLQKEQIPMENSYKESTSLDSSCSSSTSSTSTARIRHSTMTFRVKSGRVEAEKSATTNHWAGQCQSKVVQKLLKGHDKTFLLLEDLVTNYSRPCVVDLKMGTRQYGDDASAQKRLTQTQKCRQSTSSEYGVRLVGMQLFDRDTQEYIFANKYEGRRMDRAQFHTALFHFFKSAGVGRTRRLIEKLLSLHKLLLHADGFRFFSSSLLIAFDGEQDLNSSFGDDQKDITIKMIDFAHSTFNGFLNDPPYAGIDEGYLLGVDSLLRMLTLFLQQQNCFSSPFAMSMLSVMERRVGKKRRNSGGDEEDEQSRSSMYTSDSGAEEPEERGSSRMEELAVGEPNISIPFPKISPAMSQRCECEETDRDAESLVALA